MIIYNHARFILGKNATAESKARGISFFFCQTDREISFAEAAAAMSPTIRTDVILLRFQYEFWKQFIVFDSPMDWTALPVPNRVINAFSFAGGDIGTVVAREAWYQPGIMIGPILQAVHEEFSKATYVDDEGRQFEYIDLALKRANQEKTLKIIDSLADAFLLSREGDHLWVTLRNPELEQEEWAKANRRDASRSALWWTRLF